jgi:hypothetical protein
MPHKKHNFYDNFAGSIRSHENIIWQNDYYGRVWLVVFEVPIAWFLLRAW